MFLRIRNLNQKIHQSDNLELSFKFAIEIAFINGFASATENFLPWK